MKFKIEKRKLKPRQVAALVALASVPCTMYVYADSFGSLDVTYFGNFGTNTISSGYVALSVGFGNFLGTNNSATIGSFLHGVPDGLVVGTYNKTAAGARFVVGIGDDNPGENALEVHSDGSVRIPIVQGDIEMGVFGQE